MGREIYTSRGNVGRRNVNKLMDERCSPTATSIVIIAVIIAVKIIIAIITTIITITMGYSIDV